MIRPVVKKSSKTVGSRDLKPVCTKRYREAPRESEPRGNKVAAIDKYGLPKWGIAHPEQTSALVSIASSVEIPPERAK